MGEPIAIYF
ncbi:hypothetical protein PENPOL_c007G08531 [Penicillium polonicum]|uniref:Uncharacterized protein n=1 Tax=Penicillium polonicum TaxID=60169 RepID=A0A1V6NIV0_PENPO|nr:hypothetical protein PENPOL_c007G08531 [Penicillium polonicum]